MAIAEGVTVRAIPAAEARPLRRDILRPGEPPEAVVFPQDDDPLTLHAGAWVDGRLVGVATVLREAPLGEDDAGAWRLRGVATLPEARGLGYGAAVLRACLDHVARRGGGLIWCQARPEAVRFYERHGFTRDRAPAGDRGHGARWVMRRVVTAAGGAAWGAGVDGTATTDDAPRADGAAPRGGRR